MIASHGFRGPKTMDTPGRDCGEVSVPTMPRSALNALLLGD